MAGKGLTGFSSAGIYGQGYGGGGGGGGAGNGGDLGANGGNGGYIIVEY
jgi:hypothetical protein